MKRVIIFIITIITILALIIICQYANKPVLANVGVVLEALFGVLLSLFVAEIDSHGQGVKLFFQSIKYYNKNIRLSISYLYSIELDGKYLLVKGNRIDNQFQPVGGVYKFYDEAKPELEKFKYTLDTCMNNNDDPNDLRIRIKGRYLLKFMQWFQSMNDREYDPRRELEEELITTGLIPESFLKGIKYRKKYTHNNGIKFSTHLQCDEFLYSDIFELKLNDEQKQLIKESVSAHPNELCLALTEEIKRQCYDGINENIGNNAIWLLGE